MIYVVVTACMSDELEKGFGTWSKRSAEYSEHEVVSSWETPRTSTTFCKDVKDMERVPARL